MGEIAPENDRSQKQPQGAGEVVDLNASLPSRGDTRALQDSWKWEFTAGSLIRGQVVSELKKYCFRNDLEIKLDEDRNWIESDFRVKISGTAEAVNRAKIDLIPWISKLG